MPPDPHETLTFRDGLKLSVIELVTHFNPINTSQQKPNLLQDRQGWGMEAGLRIESGGWDKRKILWKYKNYKAEGLKKCWAEKLVLKGTCFLGKGMENRKQKTTTKRIQERDTEKS